MTKVINLRSVRKRMARLQAEQHAVEQRARFGMSKAERLLVKKRGDKARLHLDGVRIMDGEGR